MAVASTAIRIEGLREFQAALRKMDKGLPRQIRIVLNETADLVASPAKARVPRRSGRAAASIRVASSQREAKVKGGGGRVPYYGWLEFGGAVGRRHSVRRPFVKEGRYLYPAYESRRSRIEPTMLKGLEDLARRSGVAMS
jgi:hypothetical protein